MRCSVSRAPGKTRTTWGTSAVVFYISTETSEPGAATIERATYVPGLAQSSATARLPIYVIANGQTGSGNPQAQGLAFVALDGGLREEATAANSARLQSSRNILGSAPSLTASGNGSYTLLWDVYVGTWSVAATTTHRNTQLTTAAAVTAAAEAHDLTGPTERPSVRSGRVRGELPRRRNLRAIAVPAVACARKWEHHRRLHRKGRFIVWLVSETNALLQETPSGCAASSSRVHCEASSADAAATGKTRVTSGTRGFSPEFSRPLSRRRVQENP
jgi:hypothetical protein